MKAGVLRSGTTEGRPPRIPEAHLDGPRLPTPRSQDSYERTNWKTIVKVNEAGGDVTLPRRVLYDAASDKSVRPSGHLNPCFVEWLMGFCPGWTL